MIYRKVFLAKGPCDCNWMTPSQRKGSANTLKRFRIQKLSKWHTKMTRWRSRCQVGRRYGVSKTSVSFKYQLKHFCNVLSWSVSLRYQLLRRYDVSNWSVLLTYQWDATKTSLIDPSHWRTSRDVAMTSQHGPQCLLWNLNETSLRRRMLGSLMVIIFQIIRHYLTINQVLLRKEML